METATINLTEMETIALKTITQSDFYESARESVVWDFSVYDICSISKRSRAGVFSSLVQKGLIFIQEKEKPFVLRDGVKTRNKYYDRNSHGTIYITKEGYALLDQLEMIDEFGHFKN